MNYRMHNLQQLREDLDEYLFSYTDLVILCFYKSVSKIAPPSKDGEIYSKCNLKRPFCKGLKAQVRTLQFFLYLIRFFFCLKGNFKRMPQSFSNFSKIVYRS